MFNAHGDVVQLANAAGSVTKEYNYDSFGVEIEPDEDDNNPWRYCGEYFDKETGSIYLRMRYYNPKTGRFLTEDPIQAGLNWYTYCSNNPVVFVDPWGLVEVGLREYAETYEGAVVSWDKDTKIATVTWGTLSFTVELTATNHRDGRIYVDDSLFVDNFGVGTDTIVVYQDSVTGNVSIRAAFNFVGVTFATIEGVSAKTLFLTGIEDGWSNSTTSVYAREKSDGITVIIATGEGLSHVSHSKGLDGWSPSNPGKVIMYTNGYSADDFKVVAAHEFGHNLGIGDGYNHETYKYYNSIMCDQWGSRNGTRGRASSLDITKAVNAFKTRKHQKWS